jgi:prephenate dehydrogenase
LKELRQISVIGLGLLGASLTLAVSRLLGGVKAVGYSHRRSTREKARAMGIAHEVKDDILDAVRDADIVVLATPICTFEEIMGCIASSLRPGCIVTDVGSTKSLPHKWAAKTLPKNVHFVGSHPIAGSEQRGAEFGRDDLFTNANCILTRTRTTNAAALKRVRKLWHDLGCRVSIMAPAEHDRLLANISHLPHVTAAALVNASSPRDMLMAGRGFIDTSRVASGPANIWADILITNGPNICRGIERLSGELEKLKKAIRKNDERQIEKLLDSARSKRARLIQHKLKHREILS